MGGSKFLVGLVDSSGEILCSKKHHWSELSPRGVVADVKTAAHALLEANPNLKPQVMGATIPGLADPEKGIWVESSFSGIRDLPFASIMEKEFGLPVKLDNDVRACALAEYRLGCCKGIDHFVWITVSNGIGGCVFAGGKPYRGGSGNAGEIGHIIVEEGPGARLCKAGHQGCAEVHASGQGLAKNYISLGGRAQPGKQPPDAKAIDALARAGDQTAIDAYKLEGLYLGRAIGAAVNLLSPDKVVIGGGVSLGFDLFWPSLEETLKTHVYQNANPRLSVEPSLLGYNAALLGAAVLSFS
ncbi:ROK family protein [Leadbettera azotonutricia]|uniref:ROK domain protein n=1 Tax=Leadbettera azotonutricia (strain ATCC BAA-888 / DSM 13862 / ZAS-9) TaxID=545695 RepID=F5Y864_LEAAZ|nr:ROK family protein [Leadbettera azotonutricia]AEF82672.1 ROK domain protein [Leadbettera azotonutricia ZAS-9]